LKEEAMKILITVIVTVIIAGLLGYLLGPILIERQIAPLKGEVAQLQNRLQASEDFIKAEEEARQRTGLKADTKFPDVVKTVNRLAAGQKSIEDIMQVRFADFDARLAEMKAATGSGMNKLSQQIEDGTKKTDQRFQDNALRAKVEDARIRLVKVKSELLARNVGVAKGELDLLSQTLEGAKKLVRDDGNKKTAIERLQGMVKEIKAEMDGNLVAATDRIDLLWHELAKLSNDG
jgi:hypothetical protein